MPKVSVTCVTYNSAGFIRGCLDSLMAQSFKDFETIIVDNNSSDGTAASVLKEYPDCRLIQNTVNTGFCAAQNRAISSSSGEYILFLNPDIVLEARFIEQMVRQMETAKDIGTVCPKLLKLIGGKRSNIIDSAGHIMEKSRSVKNIGDGETDTGQYDKQALLFGASGAAPMHRKAMLDDIRTGSEYLDEDLFIGLDDVDIDLREKRGGWKTVFCAKAVAWHVRSASVSKASRTWEFYNYRNRYLLMIKNEKLLDLLRDLPFILLFDLGMFFSMLFQGQLLPVVKSVVSLAPRMTEKRKIMNEKKRS